MKQASTFQIFALSFLISLTVLILAVIGVLFFSVRSWGDRAPRPTGGEEDLSLQNYIPKAEDTATVLLICCDDRSELPIGYFLMHFNAPEALLTVIELPPETVVTVGVREDTLNGHYDYAGNENARRAAESAVLAPVERYVRISKAGMCRLIDTLGGLEISLERGYEGETLSLPAGRNRLSGELFWRLAQEVDQWPQLLRELIKQKLNDSWADRMDVLFQTLLQNTDTDITQLDYRTAQKPLRYFLRSEARAAASFHPDGIWSEDKSTFVLSKEAVEELRLMLTPPEE